MRYNIVVRIHIMQMNIMYSIPFLPRYTLLNTSEMSYAIRLGHKDSIRYKTFLYNGFGLWMVQNNIVFESATARK